MERDRTTESALQEGPGIYWTTSYEEATHYGPHVVEMALPSSFQLMPRNKKATLSTLMAIYVLAGPEHQENFLADWDTTNPRAVMARYAHQENLHDALVTLYGDLFHDDTDAYLDAVRSLGYDGIVIPKEYGAEHLIVWTPEKLRGHVYEAASREENGIKERLLRA